METFFGQDLTKAQVNESIQQVCSQKRNSIPKVFSHIV